MIKKSLLLTLLLALLVPWAAQAQETLTVYEQTTTTNEYVPFYGYYADETQRNQMIYPASELADMDGGTISQMVFYIASKSGSNNIGNWIVSLGETTATTLSGLDNTTPLTQVYSGAMSFNSDETLMTVTFTNDYTYNGGNLLVEFNHPVAASYKHYFFSGVTATGASYCYNSQRNFLPKTTFTYEAAAGDCPKPNNLVASNVTAHTADLSWESDGFEFVLQYKKASDSNWTQKWPDANSYTLTGLAAETEYQVRVAAFHETCPTDPETGDHVHSDWREISFTTGIACFAPTNLAVTPESITAREATVTWEGTSNSYVVMIGQENLAVSADFEDQTIPAAFTNTDVRPWSVTAGGANGSGYCAIPGNQGVNSSQSNLTLEVTLDNPATVSFNAKVSSEGSYDWGRFYIDGTQMMQISGNQDWTAYSYELAAGTHTLIWRYTKDSSTASNADLFYVDDIVVSAGVDSWTDYNTDAQTYTFTNLTANRHYQVKVKGNCGDEGYSQASAPVSFTTLESCPAPTDLAASDVTVNEATISWTSDAEAWQICVNDDEENLFDVTETTYTLTGLDAQTTYTVKVRTNCGDDDYSDWTTVNFTTACDAVTTFPWSDDFESYQASSQGITFNNPCWVNEHISGSGDYFFEVYSGTMGGNSTKTLRLHDMSNGTLTKLMLPEMTLPGDNYLFSIDVYRNSSNANYGEGIRVFVSTDGEIEGATELAFISRSYTTSDGNLIPAESAQGWYTYELPLGISGTCYIILRGESQYGSATYMDNFAVMPAPTCMKPTNLTQTHTNYSATLSWTPGNEGQNAWQIAYSTTSFNPNSAGFDLTTVNVIDNVNDTTYTFDKTLAANTHYYMYVRGYCGDEDYSKWVGIDFTTNIANPSPTIVTIDEITPVSAVLRWTAPAADYLESYDIYYSQTPGQPTDESLIQYRNVDADATSHILENLTEGLWYANIRAYHGENGGYSSWAAYYGATFTVPEACPKPTNLTAGNPTPNSITLNWKEGAEWQTAWTVAYAAIEGFDPDDTQVATYVEVAGPVDENGNVGPIEVVGLESDSTYYFRVKGNCGSEYGQSEWTDAVSATTLVACPVPTDLNVTLDRNNATISWTGYSDSYTVQYRTAGGYDFEIVQGFEEGLGEWTMNHCSNYTGVTTSYGDAMFRFYYTSNYPQYLISPLLNGDNGGTMSFQYARYSDNYTEYFKVGYSTTTNDPEAFTWGDEVTVTNMYDTEFLEYTYTIPAGTKYVSIACTSDDAFYLFIDDITIQSGEYHAPGDWIINDNVEDETVVIEGLEFGTRYNAQVKANCGEEYSDYVTFTTMDAVVWNNPDDWTVPEEYADVTIPANTLVIIPSGYTAYADEITIEEGGQIIMEPGAQLYHSNEIPVTVQMNVIGYDSGSKDGVGGFYLIASPINPSISAPAAGLIPENNEDPAYAGIDLYQFDQVGDGQGNEWLNYKVDNFDLNLMQGYLYASDATITAMFAGQTMPTNADLSKELEYVDSADLPGVNLVGNPFTCSAYINGGQAFYTMNKKGNEIVTAVSNTIDPLQGIFVEAEQAGDSVTFTTTPPETKGSLALNLSQGRGTIDRAIVRFGESSQLRKFQLNPNHTKVYIPMNGKDYAVVTAEEMGEMPVNFKAEKNGTYTLSFTAEEVNFNYLHLIDNMTGADVDLLATPSYTFEANTTDYATRFRLVFATGNNSTEDFAFFSNGNLVINNEGNATLQVVDVMGRIFSSETINGSASINLNGAAGVYMIRLINGENVKVQKVIIK